MLRFYRDWIADAPDELMTIVVQRKAPALPFVPAELHGELVVAVAAATRAPSRTGRAVLQPLKAFGSPVLDLCEPKPYLAHQAMFDPVVPAWLVVLLPLLRRRRAHRRGDRHHGRARDADRVADHEPRPLADGRAVARVGDDETAFNGRKAGFTVQHQRQHRDRRGLRGRARVGPDASGPRSRPTTRAST